jgi:RNA polymerase sigma-70 factor (ECF subfamily)
MTDVSRNGLQPFGLVGSDGIRETFTSAGGGSMVRTRGPDVSLSQPGPQTAGAPFDELYAASFLRLALQLYAYLGDLAAAQDLVQEAFCRAWARWNKISRYADPEAWVRRVAWNLAKSHLRHQRHADSYARRQRPEAIAGPSPDHVALTRALATIPPAQRRALVLFYMAGLSIPQIADLEGTAEGTVKSWLSRGRAKVAETLGETGRWN